MALDLSLSAAGMVAVPVDWNGDFSRIQKATTGETVPLGSLEVRHLGRLHRISSEIVAFCERHHCTHAVCEGYSYGSKFGRERLGEIGGVVKLALLTRAGVEFEEPVPPKAGRKLLLGAEPKGNPKAVVRKFFVSRGLPSGWTEDELDALVTANFWIRRHGHPGFETPVVQVAKKTRRRAA